MQISLRPLIITALVSLLFGFAGAGIWSISGMGDRQVRAYMLAHPELLPQMAEAYQKSESEKRLAGISGAITAPFPGAVLGNPNGSVTLVEFTDYACTYCRASEPEVTSLIKANPDLRVVVREWPIFQGSDRTAALALGAAKQGKYAAFHHAMFSKGPPSDATIAASAKEVGLDLAAAQEFARSDAVKAELQKNFGLAQQLGFTGTPSWVIGNQALEGAVGADTLQRAIDAAKDK